MVGLLMVGASAATHCRSGNRSRPLLIGNDYYSGETFNAMQKLTVAERLSIEQLKSVEQHLLFMEALILLHTLVVASRR